MIDGLVDMGNQSIVVPEGGISISGLNGARDTAILFSSEDNHTFFVSPDGGYSGGGVLESCTIDATGANPKVWNCDNQGNSGAWDVSGVNFGRSPASTITLGNLDNYRQGLFFNVGLVFAKDGLTLNGTWTGFRASTSIAIVFPSLATLFKAGTGFTIDNFFSDFNFLSVQADSVFCDFSESHITSKGGFSLENLRTVADDPLPNLDGSSVYARFRNCNGVRNTYVGGQWEIATAQETVINAVDTPTKMAGITATNDLQWFDDDGGTNNRLRYIGEQTIEVEVKGIVSLSGGNNDQAKAYFRQWDASESVWIDGKEILATLNGGLLGTRAEGIALLAFFILDENDFIEVFLENATDTSNITSEVGGLFAISERPS